jgi:nucleotide-binding universal stress UspA family protein
VTHILCPIDLSDISRHVVDHASALARWHGARLTFLHVVIASPAMGIPPLPIDETTQHELVDAMRKAAETVPPLVQAEFLVRQAESAVTAILDEAVDRRADILVVGTHGRSGFKRLLLGSVAEAVIRRSPCPTFVVPPRAADIPAATPVRFRHILCAVDFSECSTIAATQALQLSHETAAHLTLLHVIETPPELSEDTLATDFNVDRIRAAAEAEALRRLRDLVPHGSKMPEAVTTAVEEGEPVRALLQTAADVRADLIVMGVHGRSTVDLLVFGSTAYHVIREAPCPVLIVRQD